MFITVKETHNPNCMKFLVDFVWLDMLWECKDEFTARKSKLAHNLWGVDGVVYLLFGMEFVLVTKTSESDWDELGPVVIEVISDYLVDHKKVFESVFEDELKKINRPVLDEFSQKIEAVLKDKVQPALAMHGGSVEMISFKDGVLQISLQGACRNCPGSEETLKYGIQHLLQYYFPEIKEVKNLEV